MRTVARVSCCELTQHQHPVTDHRGELFDTVEEFGLLGKRRSLKPLSRRRQIVTHQSECAFDALMIGGAPMGALARGLKVAYLDNLCHDVAYDYCSPTGSTASARKLRM